MNQYEWRASGQRAIYFRWYRFHVADRITISLDADTKRALESLREQTSANQSELVRSAIQFYEANLDVTESDDSDSLWRYSRALSAQDHVLLDRDFFHLFLQHVPNSENFESEVERIASYHAPEYNEEFQSPLELLEWLSFCGFLEYKQVDGQSIQLIFHNEDVKDVMGPFTVTAIEEMGHDVTVVRTGITKVVLDIEGFDSSE